MTRMIYVCFLTLLTLVSFSNAKILERCQFARELLKYGVPKNQIPTFVCIANFESHFDTQAQNRNTGDHGILQISQIYWCSASGTPGKECKTTCDRFRDDNLADDIACARKVFAETQRLKGNGFTAWSVYKPHCAGNNDKWVNGCI